MPLAGSHAPMTGTGTGAGAVTPAPAGGSLPLRIAPSLLSSDFARLAEELAEIEQAGADWHHVDVMDGHFVPNMTIGPPVVAAIHAAARRPLDVHLMIQEPGRYAEAFAQ